MSIPTEQIRPVAQSRDLPETGEHQVFIAALTGWLNARRRQAFSKEQVAEGLNACRAWARRAAAANRQARQPEDV